MTGLLKISMTIEQSNLEPMETKGKVYKDKPANAKGFPVVWVLYTLLALYRHSPRGSLNITGSGFWFAELYDL